MLDSKGPGKNRSVPGGAAGAHSAHTAGAGAFGPRPCGGFAGPSGPQNAAAPPRTPPRQLSNPRASPPPPALRRLPGSAGRMGRTCGGGGGVWRPGGGPRAAPRPAKQKSGVRGQGPRAPLFQDASRPAAAPPPPGFPPTPKRQRKARPYVQRAGPVHDGERWQRSRSVGRSRLPYPTGEPAAFARSGAVTTGRTAPRKGRYGASGGVRGDEGSGGINRPAAGCYPRATAPASARRSPPA